MTNQDIDAPPSKAKDSDEEEAPEPLHDLKWYF